MPFADIKHFNSTDALFRIQQLLQRAPIQGHTSRPLGHDVRLKAHPHTSRPLGHNVPYSRSHPGSPKSTMPSGNDVPTAFSVSQLMAQIDVSGGLARQNKYMVIIPTWKLKAASTTVFNANSSALQFPEDSVDWMDTYFSYDLGQQQTALVAFCERSQIPGYQFQMDTARHYGPAFKFPHLPEYQDITLSYLCGAAMKERAFFDAWMYMVMDPISNNFNYISEYCTDITIVQYNETAQDGGVSPNYVSVLIDAYPIAVSQQELAFDANNSIQKFDVTFTYKFALPFSGKGSTAGVGTPNASGTSQPFTQTIS